MTTHTLLGFTFGAWLHRTLTATWSITTIDSEKKDATLNRAGIHLQVDTLQLISWGQQGLLPRGEFTAMTNHMHREPYYNNSQLTMIQMYNNHWRRATSSTTRDPYHICHQETEEHIEPGDDIPLVHDRGTSMGAQDMLVPGDNDDEQENR
eukprot:5819671-Heterocapsa_arctica.AAC.1